MQAAAETSPRAATFSNMKALLPLLFTLLPLATSAQTCLSGRVISADRQQPLAGATVLANRKGQALRAVTDVQGRFQLALPPGRWALACTAPSHGTVTRRLRIRKGHSDSLNLALPFDLNRHHQQQRIYQFPVQGPPK